MRYWVKIWIFALLKWSLLNLFLRSYTCRMNMQYHFKKCARPGEGGYHFRGKLNLRIFRRFFNPQTYRKCLKIREICSIFYRIFNWKGWARLTCLRMILPDLVLGRPGVTRTRSGTANPEILLLASCFSSAIRDSSPPSHSWRWDTAHNTVMNLNIL